MTHAQLQLTRRAMLVVLAGAATGMMANRAWAQDNVDITVWRDPSCGCCSGWVEHLRRSGFTVHVTQSRNLAAIKQDRGVPPTLESCHTALMAGYTIEGHVPAHAVRRLLTEKPVAKGLAVPGMPIGSPGMEGPGAEAYSVMLFGEGAPKVFGTYLNDRPA